MINNVTLMGRLTFEPELRATTTGLSVINFRIACDRNYQARGENRKADFIDCQAWRKTAEFINSYFHKGDMIAIQGSIQTDEYTDKEGNKRKTVTVVADKVSFCGSKSDGNANQQYAQTSTDSLSADFEEIVDDDDDLPF